MIFQIRTLNSPSFRSSDHPKESVQFLFFFPHGRLWSRVEAVELIEKAFDYCEGKLWLLAWAMWSNIGRIFSHPLCVNKDYLACVFSCFCFIKILLLFFFNFGVLTAVLRFLSFFFIKFSFEFELCLTLEKFVAMTVHIWRMTFASIALRPLRSLVRATFWWDFRS